MKSLVSIILGFHILICSCILPGSDFNLLNQIPNIYEQYQKVNGDTSFSEFIEEQFFNIFAIKDGQDEPNDEPFEKEQHSVPVDLFSINQTIFIKIDYFITEFKPVQELKIIFIPYIENYKNLFLKSIFHPPEK